IVHFGLLSLSREETVGAGRSTNPTGGPTKLGASPNSRLALPTAAFSRSGGTEVWREWPFCGAVSALSHDFRLRSRLFGNLLARSSEFGRNILEFRQAIAHRQNRLGVINVKARFERQGGHGRRI